MPANGASALTEGASDYCMADYQPLLTRAVAQLPSTSTVATRHAIYERARKAQLAQLRTLRPPLRESDIAREEEALEQAIALVEAKFGGTDSTPAEPPFAVAANAGRTESSIPPLSNLGKVVPPSARAEKGNSWLWLPLAAVLGAVLAVGGSAIALRQKPQDLAAAPPEAQQEPAPQDPAKKAQRAQPWSTEGKSTAPAASVPP